jgi:hypothetical protein
MSHTSPPNWSDPSACAPSSSEERARLVMARLAEMRRSDDQAIAWLLWSIRRDMVCVGIDPPIAAFYTRERS